MHVQISSSEHCPASHRRGSVYLITLLCVASIVSMALIGASVRLSESSQTQTIISMTGASSQMLSATEIAMEKVLNDPDWVEKAQKGMVFSEFTIDGITLSSHVTDAKTGVLPTESTTQFRIHLTTENQNAKYSTQFDMNVSRSSHLDTLNSLKASFYWPMNESAGTSKAIESIAGNGGGYLDSSIVGAISNNQGDIAPHFKDNKDHLVVPYHIAMTSANGAISFWMYLDSTNGLETNVPLSMLYDDDQQVAITTVVTGSTVLAYIGDGERMQLTDVAKTSSGVVSAKQWHHVLVCWGNPDGLGIYIDGKQAAINTSNTNTLSTGRPNNGGEQPLLIGGGYIASPIGSVFDGFEGSIAHFAMIPKKVTEDEIELLATPMGMNAEVVQGTWARAFPDVD